MKFLFIIFLIQFVYGWDQISKYNYTYSTQRLNQYFEVASINHQINLGSKINTSPIFGLNNNIYTISGDSIYSLNTIDLSIQWRYITSGNITTDMYLKDNIIIFGTDNNLLYNLFTNGTLNWIYNVNNSQIRYIPFIDYNNNIFFCTNNQQIYSLTNSGSLLWNIAFNSSTTNHVIINPNSNYNHQLYLFQYNGIVVINKYITNVLWTIDKPFGFNGLYPSFSIDGILYISDTSNYNYAIAPNGTIIWQSVLDYVTYNSLILSHDQQVLYFCTENNYLYAISALDGSLIYKQPTDDTISYTLSLSPDGNTLYGSGWYGSATAFNTNDGTTRWTIPLGTQLRTSPAISDDGKYIYYGNIDNIFYKIKSECQNKIINCQVNVTFCDTFESVNNCPLSMCNIGYYNNIDFPRCTLCPLKCNDNQYVICDELGNNAQCIFYNNTLDGEWKRFYGNNQQNGVYWNNFRFNEQFETATIFNNFKTDNYIRSSPVIVNNEIYFHSNDGYMYAIYSNNTLKWKTNTNDYTLYNTPAISNDNQFIYIITFNGLFYKIFTLNGTIDWFIDTQLQTYSSPAITKNNNIYITLGDGSIHCYANNGTLLWITNFGYPAAYNSLTFNNDESIIYTTDSMNTVYALYSNNGSIIWQLTIPNASVYSIIYDDNNLYFTTSKNYYNIYANNGTIIYEITNPYYTYWPCIIYKKDNKLYCNGDKYIYALELTTGQLIWSFKTDNNFDSAPIVSADGSTIININLGGYIYGIRNDGTLKFRMEIPNKPIVVTTPAISNDGFFIYFGADDGNLYTVKIGCPNGNNCLVPSPLCSTKQDNNLCYPRKCENGYYNDLYQNSMCMPCPSPSHCKYNNAVYCDYNGSNSICPLGLCNDGFYNNQTSICLSCPSALHCNTTISTKCIINGLNPECPLGMCNKGYYNLITSGICLKCPQNKFCLTESESCDNSTGLNPICPVGYCQSGYYNNNLNKECQLCNIAENCKVNYTSSCDHNGLNSKCPLKLCNDGFYNEGYTANGFCIKCPRAYMCKSDTFSCDIDGINPLCPADQCEDGYTNNGYNSVCIEKPREYTSTQIGIFSSVGGVITVLIFTIIFFRHKIYECINNKKIHNYKNILNMSWLIFKGIIFPIINISSNIAAYINLVDRPKIFQYDLLNVYTAFIVFSIISAIISIMINIYLLLKIIIDDNDDVNSLKHAIWKESPSLVQLFMKNIPMIIINNLLIINDNKHSNITNNIYYVTITLNALTVGLNITSIQRLIESYMNYRETLERKETIIMTKIPQTIYHIETNEMIELSSYSPNSPKSNVNE